MNQEYYDAVVQLEKTGVDAEYLQGQKNGYFVNPEREEEQRLKEAGYSDGVDHNIDGFKSWVKQ